MRGAVVCLRNRRARCTTGGRTPLDCRLSKRALTKGIRTIYAAVRRNATSKGGHVQRTTAPLTHKRTASVSKRHANIVTMGHKRAITDSAVVVPPSFPSSAFTPPLQCPSRI
ncbi:hypothetical protein EVAR_22054_1 [Eumeta japonica]|uniref:Uncharacterized protein n=1 Tax=Eumeta variegata TaxID=151549 RepID=A0A4C1UTW9_EUMVA|nr:hypothetical protein EVAR_22054_1 [Eumeta japonica]